MNFRAFRLFTTVVSLGMIAAACGSSGGDGSSDGGHDAMGAGGSQGADASGGGTTGGGGSSAAGAGGSGGAVAAGGSGGAGGTGGFADAGGAGGRGGSAGAGGAGGTGGSAGAGGAGGTGGSAGSGGAGGTGGSAGSGGAGGTGGSALAEAGGPGWTLTWSDEFNGPDGSAVDSTKWVHDVGGTGWGNNELEYYTDGAQNAVVEGGYLVITATTANASQYQCSYPSSGPCEYTSARLKTEGLFSQEYGRFEARVQMPTGQGLWPAVWMLGNDISTVSWPACGEIDFMETIGSDITTNHGSLHMPASYGPTATYALPGGASFADAFHTFAIEWEPGTISFYVDDQLYETQTQASVPAGDTWEFSQPFFLLINVAVGGTWPGSPDSTTTFPQTMKVDWVRVYQKNMTEP